jgi:DNA-binding transcriptional ArsR family regulator
MTAETYSDTGVCGIAVAIGEPARARMLYCLMDGHARTSTELAIVAEVTPSTASVHLHRLNTEGLVKVVPQGRHRYYSLNGSSVSSVLEGLSILAGGSRTSFEPNTPNRLRTARTCYDHLAGTLAVALHNRFREMNWLSDDPAGYDVTTPGSKAFEALGIDVAATRLLRRRFAYPCLDWSERQPHIGGGLGAALLSIIVKKKWVVQDLDSRAISVTSLGQREMLKRFRV